MKVVPETWPRTVFSGAVGFGGVRVIAALTGTLPAAAGDVKGL